MVFVPVVPPPRPPSGRALDLGRRLKAEVERFEKEYPGTSREDLRAAANLAIGEDSSTVPARRRVAAILMGMMGALVALGVAMTGASKQGAAPWPIMAMIVAVIIVGLLAVAVRRSRQE
jgi:hypothetical protein